jgi:hypothetical protein
MRRNSFHQETGPRLGDCEGRPRRHPIPQQIVYFSIAQKVGGGRILKSHVDASWKGERQTLIGRKMMENVIVPKSTEIYRTDDENHGDTMKTTSNTEAPANHERKLKTHSGSDPVAVGAPN